MGLFDDVHHIAELKTILKENNIILSNLATTLEKLQKSISELNTSIKKQQKGN